MCGALQDCVLFKLWQPVRGGDPLFTITVRRGMGERLQEWEHVTCYSLKTGGTWNMFPKVNLSFKAHLKSLTFFFLFIVLCCHILRFLTDFCLGMHYGGPRTTCIVCCLLPLHGEIKVKTRPVMKEKNILYSLFPWLLWCRGWRHHPSVRSRRIQSVPNHLTAQDHLPTRFGVLYISQTSPVKHFEGWHHPCLGTVNGKVLPHFCFLFQFYFYVFQHLCKGGGM